MAQIGQVVIQPASPLPVTEGSQDWNSLMRSTTVDLASPDSICTVALSMVPRPSEGNHDIAILRANCSTLIALCQESLGKVLSASFREPHFLELSGVYDCETARGMVVVADLLGRNTGNQSSWPLEERELAYLLTASSTVQRMALGVMPHKTGAVALQTGHFAPAFPPVGCGGPTGTNGTSGGTPVAFGEQPEAGSGTTNSGSLWPAIAIGMAASVLALVAYTGSTQRRG